MFRNVGDLLAVRKDIMPLALANSAKLTAVDAYAEVVQAEAAGKNVYFDGDDETDTNIYKKSGTLFKRVA